MPNGGTDNCMNCQHNRANQAAANIKTAQKYTRIPFCTVHHIPVWNHAWTYCTNIGSDHPEINIPINTVGLSSEGYSRIPWLGRTAPFCSEQVSNCQICGVSGNEGIRLKSDVMGIDASFCSNDHYRQWYQAKLDDSGLENVYEIERNQIHQSVLDSDYASFNTHAEIRDNINEADIFGWTPLHLAAFLGLEEFVSRLVEAGSDARAKDCVGNMPIDLAGSEGYTKIVGFLVPITFVSEESRQEALLNAAERGNLELVEALIKSGTDIECKDYRGRTPLILAVWQGHYTTSVYLLDHGANIHVQDDYGNSPLKIVDTWNSKRPDDIYHLVHKWIQAKG